VAALTFGKGAMSLSKVGASFRVDAAEPAMKATRHRGNSEIASYTRNLFTGAKDML
jgi:hypothetical protein